MKKRNRILCLVLAIFMLASVFGILLSVRSSAYSTEGDYEYAVYGSSAEGWYASVHLYKGNSEYPIIPETLGGYTVKNIGMSSFENKTKIKSVSMPDTVVTISSAAFKGCSNLGEIKFSENVSNISADSFEGTKWLKNQPDGMIYVNSILAYKYKGTCPAEFTVRDGIKDINQGAFSKSSTLETLHLPESVEDITAAFSGCASLKNINLPTRLKGIGMQAFYGCSALEEIVIPSTVTYFSDSSFRNCVSLRKINFPAGLKKISYGAFQGCSSLESVDLPDGLRTIENSAFADCILLDGFRLPDSVGTLGASSFNNTKWYNDLPDGIVYLGKFACSYKGEIPENVTFKEGTEVICDNFFYNNKTAKKVVLPQGLKEIGAAAFRESAVEEVNLPDGLTDLGSYCFFGASVKSLIIPGSIKNLERDVVTQCGNLEYVEILDGIEEIGYNIFASCANLKEVVIGEGLKAIPDQAFYRCTGLKTITLPSTLERIHTYAFPQVTLETIKGYSGTYAESYAEEKNIPFVSLGQAPASQSVTEPATEAPSTEAPTTAPVTDEPTTAASTTAEPTTEAPTTAEPTTEAPSTVEPTTAAPTTAEPTTEAPTTAEPTTAAPTTAEPTTEAPTTQPTTTQPATKKPSLTYTKKSIAAAGKFTLSVKNKGTAKLTYSTSNKKVATVTSKGVVTGLQRGAVTITVKVGTTKLTCKVVVTNNPVAKISGKSVSSSKIYKIKKGNTLTVKLYRRVAAIKNVVTTSNKKVAKITSKANADKVTVKGIKIGKATIKIKINGVRTFTVKVKVVKK